MGTNSANGSRDFNSPTPQADTTRLDVNFENVETRTHGLETSMINISVEKEKPLPARMEIPHVSVKNNSQRSNEVEIDKSVVKHTQNVGTSPMPPREVKIYKNIAIGTGEQESQNFELK